ncbi:MAG: MiaB/RimO family radical SAM methylthiotransferase, partial [Chloroflexota bacterium]
KKIRQANRGGIEQIVVTGCMSTLAPQETAQLPGVIKLIPNENKDNLVPDLLGIEINQFDLEPISREPLPGTRLRTRAFIKVQDGCDNKCTFCVTTVARGEGRSRSIMDVVADIRAAVKGGAQEAVLTGVHLGSWGYDFPQPQHLRALIEKILEVTEIPRLRISSLEPWDLDESFFDLWENPRLCRHLHLPLQSGSAATLKRMARKTTPRKFARLVEAARKQIPQVAITTDIITGFPGETEGEFEETRKFVKEIDFAGAHIFTYSEREDTAAASMPGPVQHGVRKDRNAILRELIDHASQAFQKQFVGQEMDVLWEGYTAHGDSEWQVTGLTDNYIRVQSTSPQPIWNQITPTQLTNSNPAGLMGRITRFPDTITIGGDYA